MTEFRIFKRMYVAFAMAVAFTLLLSATARAGEEPIHQSYVCKYVGTPGVNETLQTGQNPILVDNHAIGEDPVVEGSYFNDAQGRSYVLVANTAKLDPEPSASQCPQYAPSVTVEGPCADPLYGFIFDNTLSNIDVRFTVTWGTRTRSRVVAAGSTLERHPFHAVHGTVFTVTASAAGEPTLTLLTFTAVGARTEGWTQTCPWQQG